MSSLDLVVRGGTVVDGTGAAPRVADVAVADGVVVEVGKVAGRGRREIHADGAIVAPGFVDAHTHYDGQAVWDDRLQPSSWHGVTTVVTGNCGVGFAPVLPQHRDLLIELMEGVEDIPGTALYEGITWEWTSFDDYLSALERRPRDLDLATQVPHAALRFYAMGERAAAFEQASPDEIELMARLARDAVLSGALGFSTSRTLAHKTKAGAVTPVYGTAEQELTAIAAAIGGTGRGVLQLITDFPDVAEDMALLRGMASASGRPVTVSLFQTRERPELYRQILDELSAANADGLRLTGQVACRGIGALMGLHCPVHPLVANPVWLAMSHLPVPEQARRMSDPLVRQEILAAQTDAKRPDLIGGMRIDRFEWMFPLGELTPDYEPKASESLAAQAAATGRDPLDLAYDILISDDGQGFIHQPFANYAYGSLDAAREMMVHPNTVPGLGDGGAHVASICDSSFPTTLLQHWVRDRDHDRLDLAYVVQQQARDTARSVGLLDRGVLLPGYRADINVIDLDGLRLHCPRMAYDLPAGGKRLLQRADGYLHTFVAGVQTYQDGESTGALPGRVVRGPQAARGTDRSGGSHG
ncbi:MAG: D-aminoacylase [Actinomycetota bacterium]|nr:MAG: D-aminoacylase [Actinomycetota bacterium]